MEELRLVRRDDLDLIVTAETGEEFRLVVDDTVLNELRQLIRQADRAARGPVKVSPREVQKLVRAGKTRAEIAELTGAEEADIERYEEPVLAERRYMLELAHAVPVRTSPGEAEDQQFGTVIAERLIALGAGDAEWSSWRDEEAGWMIGLLFASHDVHHRAVWSFEHRKRLLSPVTPDATTLSKQGEVGDRLIPKLRAVDANESFDAGTFDAEGIESIDEAALRSGPVSPDHPSTGSIPIVDMDAEFARRQHIEERAIKTPETELPDLGQTADLLDALRKRRGERDAAAQGGQRGVSDETLPAQIASRESDRGETFSEPLKFPGVAFGAATVPEAVGSAENASAASAESTTPAQMHAAGTGEQKPAESTTDKASEKRGRGRASIPSWDDILFGTRSDEDPS